MASAKKKILIVEDERAMAKALQLKLQSSGFDVDVTFDGEMALEKVADGHFDLILLDLVIPKKDGVKGLA